MLVIRPKWKNIKKRHISASSSVTLSRFRDQLQQRVRSEEGIGVSVESDAVKWAG